MQMNSCKWRRQPWGHSTEQHVEVVWSWCPSSNTQDAQCFSDGYFFSELEIQKCSAVSGHTAWAMRMRSGWATSGLSALKLRVRAVLCHYKEFMHPLIEALYIPVVSWYPFTLWQAFPQVWGIARSKKDGLRWVQKTETKCHGVTNQVRL